MRPHQLVPLFASARNLSGIGPRMEILLKSALRLPPGVSEPRVIDLLWHAPTGRHRPPRHADGGRRRARHDRHARGARPEAQAGPARQHQGALQGHLRGRDGQDRPRVLPCRAQLHRAPAADREPAHGQRPRGELQRQEADVAPRLYRRRRRPAPSCRCWSRSIRSPRASRARCCSRPFAKGSTACLICPSGRTRPGSRAAAGRISRPRSRACIAPRRRPTSRPDRRRGSVWPTTSCWRGSWHWRWCARASSRSQAAASKATGRSARASPMPCRSRSPTRSARP